MQTVNVHDAKTRLSQLLSAVEAGEDIVIARKGVAVARLVAIASPQAPAAGGWRALPGWDTYVFDASMLAPLDTDEELAREGWQV